ncbi:hypothetical protein [Gracilibacillus sp. JCM 18860]|uniref:hypothetical protein n=1 Tax=Gracilibacillus sp. JCM 18860 TaxID=1306159 RepID=UPI0006CFB114
MGKQKLVKGIIFGGAVIGGLVSLGGDRDTRRYVRSKCQVTKQRAQFYIKNPSDLVRELNQFYQKGSEQLSTGLSQALEILNQLQEMTRKIDKK